MIDQYAVIGNPVAHSQSPVIHAAFAKQTNQAISYEKIEAPIDGFAQTVNDLIAAGFKGVNVTVPFKFDAFELATQQAASSINAEASNTLKFEKNAIVAYNTDGIGLVTDIENNLNRPLKNKHVLMLGAGGAAQGVAETIAASHPAQFVVANRSLEKVHVMQQKLEGNASFSGTAITASSFQSLTGQVFDIVINATSTGLSNAALPIPDSIFGEGCLAYDMMYGIETPFMAQAKASGATISDGLGMLVEQAAEAFYIWRGVRPLDTQAVIQQLRA